MSKGSQAYFPFQLQPKQEEAFLALTRFANGQGKVFILRGYAGTGKTTLMSGYIKWLQEQKINHCLLASTGRAAKILKDKTGSAASTVHSKIYNFNQLNQDLETIAQFREDRRRDDKGKVLLLFGLHQLLDEPMCIYIVDEASMINDAAAKPGETTFATFGSGKLLTDLLRFHPSGKFVFVGDPVQLPPVGQDFSPALDHTYFAQSHGIMALTFTLTDIMRQIAGNDIITASMHIRSIHSNPTATRVFQPLPLKGYQNIKLHTDQKALVDSYIALLETKDFSYATLICHRNEDCMKINTHIRKYLFNNPPILIQGDLLLVTQNNTIVPLCNGDLVRLVSYGATEYRCQLQFVHVEVEEIGSKTRHKLLLIADILGTTATNIRSFQYKNLIIDFYHRMKSEGIYQANKAFKERMRTDPYLNALRAVYGFALTCHKSQGGEWPEVFLYLADSITKIPTRQRYQWAYTAVTRAGNTLHVVDNRYIC